MAAEGSDAIQALIATLARLPGLGPRSARRIVLHLIRKRAAQMGQLATLLATVAGLLQFASVKALVMVAAVYGTGQVVEGLYFTPRLVGKRIGLHPLAVIFALLAFGQVFGFVGVLVALPASAVLLVAMRRVRAGYLGSRLYHGG